MIKSFTRQHVNNDSQLRKDIESALTAVATKHGIQIKTGKAHYMHDGTSADITLDLATIAANGQVNSREVADWNNYAEMFGFKKDALGATFVSGGRDRDTFKIIGINPKARTRPILAQNLTDGKTYVFQSHDSRLAPFKTKPLFGSTPVPQPLANGVCQNDAAYDDKYQPIGKCNRKATTRRKVGFGRGGEWNNLCDQCARAHDEAVQEMKAEARMS